MVNLPWKEKHVVDDDDECWWKSFEGDGIPGPERKRGEIMKGGRRNRESDRNNERRDLGAVERGGGSVLERVIP